MTNSIPTSNLIMKPTEALREEFPINFGRFLADVGALDELAIQRAQRASRQSGERFDQVLTKLGLIAETELSLRLARYLGLRHISEAELPVKAVDQVVISEQFIRNNRILPIDVTIDTFELACVDPFNTDPINAVAYATGRTVTCAIIAATVFEKAIATNYFAEIALPTISLDARLDEASDGDIQRLRNIANEAPVIKRVNQLISKAIELGASDIHIEPRLDGVHIRYRVDGNLREIDVIPPGLKSAISSRFKIMAGLDIAERRLPQDGRIRLPVRGLDIDFRVSTIPTAHGESIVMRILDRSRVALDFHALGFSDDTMVGLREIIKSPNGVFLVTGPTGSGKTTTLYTILKELNKPDLKIFTVEDPIEYQLAGINQVQIHPAIGMDFPHVLRAILRQDPDIIMIGEIRDTETARIAIQAALTGHLVLSTLHTNGAAASITRLTDMGIEDYLIASTLKGVLAQRLVRRICHECSQPLATADVWASKLARNFSCHGAQNFLAAKGCGLCQGTGYAGRSTIAELLKIDESIHALICKAGQDVEINKAAQLGGMRSLYLDGMGKAWRGETTVEEVLRVVRSE